MLTNLNDEVDEDLNKLRLAINNPVLRRQLLWLRAKEKGDEDSAADLVRIEPAIREWAFALEIEGDTLPSYQQRAHWYADRWHEHYDTSVQRLRCS